MAKAIAICTCKTCGKEFEKTAMKGNRRDADSWEKWAVESFDECPTCYGKRMREEKVAKGLVADIRIDHIAALHEGKAMMVLVTGGDTQPHKDELRAQGFRWTDDYPTENSAIGQCLTLKRTPYTWVRRFLIDDWEKEAAAFEALGGKIEKIPTEMGIALLHDELAYFQKQQEEQKKVLTEKAAKEREQKALAEAAAEKACGFPRPVKPESLCEITGTHRWNGKIYGKKGRYCVYLDGEKTSITDDVAKEWNTYVDHRDEFEAAFFEALGEIQKEQQY